MARRDQRAPLKLKWLKDSSGKLEGTGIHRGFLDSNPVVVVGGKTGYGLS